MNIPLPLIALLGLSLAGSALALAAFVWAVGTGQMDPGGAGGRVIFDDPREDGDARDP